MITKHDYLMKDKNGNVIRRLGFSHYTLKNFRLTLSSYGMDGYYLAGASQERIIPLEDEQHYLDQVESNEQWKRVA